MLVVAPGDKIGQLPPTGVVRTSTAVVRRGEELFSTQPGTIVQGDPNAYEIRCKRKRYNAVAKDDVIGIIISAPMLPLVWYR
jgi:exosome complex RNA-binding protein Rrp4